MMLARRQAPRAVWSHVLFRPNAAATATAAAPARATAAWLSGSSFATLRNTERQLTNVQKEKEKQKIEKENMRARKLALKEKADLKAAKEKEKEKAKREQLKAKAEKDKLAARVRRERERERARKEKEKDKAEAVRAKAKAERDLKASKPKRATTPYALFMKQNYGRIAAANPHMKITDVARALAEEWKSFPQSKKDELAAEAAEDRERWMRETEEWKAAQPPKRPKSAYLLFCDDHREEAARQLPSGARVTDVAKVLGGMWNVLPDSEKAPYQEKADLLLADWNREMAAIEWEHESEHLLH